MARTPVIIGNWKMNKTVAETQSFAATMINESFGGLEVGVAPPMTALAAAVEAFKGTNVKVFSQNVHWEDNGAFTGEVSAPMLKSLGVTGSLIGHSERRQYFGETDATVAKRLKAALKHGLQPVVCFGETLEERQRGAAFEVVRRQVQTALEGLGPSVAATLILAYEPVWAIGTGETASPAQAQEVHAFVRDELGKLFGPDGAKLIRIQYGGSVKPENVAELLGQEDIDGALVGGASLDPISFAKLLQFR